MGRAGDRLARERPEAGPQPLHARLLAPADVQLDGKRRPRTDSAEGQTAGAWWKLLYQHHATLILNGHDHVYSRFASMDPTGNADPQHGIREFIVGTGGESLDNVIPSTPNLQAWSDQYYGVMKLTLKPSGYEWDYKSAMLNPGAPAGTPANYHDAGSASCSNGNG